MSTQAVQGQRGDCSAPEVSRALRYAVARAAWPGKSKRWAARTAGYSRNSQTSRIEATLAVQSAIQSVQQYRQQLQQCPDASLGAMVAQLIGIVTATETIKDPATGRKSTTYVAPPRDRVAAVRQVSTMLGYDAPQQVQTEVRGLLVEFSGHSSDDLRAMAAAVAQGAG